MIDRPYHGPVGGGQAADDDGWLDILYDGPGYGAGVEVLEQEIERVRAWPPSKDRDWILERLNQDLGFARELKEIDAARQAAGNPPPVDDATLEAMFDAEDAAAAEQAVIPTPKA